MEAMMNSNTEDSDQYDLIAEKKRQEKELSFLFGKEIVEQARLIDVVDFNLSDEMTKCISKGVTRLKNLHNQADAQIQFIEEMAPGERLVLCMWIMEMDLLPKLQSSNYVQS
jgi:hypothetical protein